jgi:hypothetical protein
MLGRGLKRGNRRLKQRKENLNYAPNSIEKQGRNMKRLTTFLIVSILIGPFTFIMVPAALTTHALNQTEMLTCSAQAM